jgi:hypothetical protein
MNLASPLEPRGVPSGREARKEEKKAVKLVSVKTVADNLGH